MRYPWFEPLPIRIWVFGFAITHKQLVAINTWYQVNPKSIHHVGHREALSLYFLKRDREIQWDVIPLNGNVDPVVEPEDESLQYLLVADLRFSLGDAPAPQRMPDDWLKEKYRSLFSRELKNANEGLFTMVRYRGREWPYPMPYPVWIVEERAKLARFLNTRLAEMRAEHKKKAEEERTNSGEGSSTTSKST